MYIYTYRVPALWGGEVHGWGLADGNPADEIWPKHSWVGLHDNTLTHGQSQHVRRAYVLVIALEKI